MVISLQDAMGLPQAEYLAPTVTLSTRHLVSAPMNGWVISNPLSRRNIPCTKIPLEGCLGIVVENKVTQEVAVAHATLFRHETLDCLLKQVRKNQEDTLEVHLIGSLDMGGESSALWRQSMQKMLDIMNDMPNVELKTFDVGSKPHPATFAVVIEPNGVRLVRGTKDVYNLQSFWDITGETREAQRIFRKNHALDGAYQPRLPQDVKFSAANPVHLCYDGRRDMQQRQDATPPTFHASNK